MVLLSRASNARGGDEFVKAFSRFDAVMFVAGSMIGSAIFIVPADIVRQVGSPGLLLLVWAITGIVIVFGALSYGELSAMYPDTGGLYVYLREGLSPLFGYLYGWALFCVIQSGAIAAVAVAFARFTGVLFPGLTPTVFVGVTMHFPSGPIEIGLSWQRILAIASIAVLTWVNVRGVKRATALQTTLTILKTTALCGLILIGVTIGRHPAAIAANFGPAFWPAGGFRWSTLPVIGAAMVGSIAAADLWYQIGYAGGEIKNPQRDIPAAMVRGALLVVILYFLANVAYLCILPATGIAGAPQDRVGSTALQAVFGAPGLYIMAAAVALSCFGCNAALILSAPRVYYAMARDGLFFRGDGSPAPANTRRRRRHCSPKPCGLRSCACRERIVNCSTTWYLPRCCSICSLSSPSLSYGSSVPTRIGPSKQSGIRAARDLSRHHRPPVYRSAGEEATVHVAGTRRRCPGHPRVLPLARNRGAPQGRGRGRRIALVRAKPVSPGSSRT